VSWRSDHPPFGQGESLDVFLESKGTFHGRFGIAQEILSPALILASASGRFKGGAPCPGLWSETSPGEPLPRLAEPYCFLAASRQSTREPGGGPGSPHRANTALLTAENASQLAADGFLGPFLLIYGNTCLGASNHE